MEAGQAGVDGVLAAELVELVSKSVIEVVPLLLRHMEGGLAQVHRAKGSRASKDTVLVSVWFNKAKNDSLLFAPLI